MIAAWRWSLSDLPKPTEDAPKVFSCFSCGGGSSMGFKLAGCDVIGFCEIDPRMAAIYEGNLNPKLRYVMDLRDFNALDDLPEELYDLDILDGSPPCSTFSMSGDREKSWSKAKKFAEGQKVQTLDDLFMVFLDTVEKLQPKIVVAENVTGLIKGNAKGYVNEVINRFREIGYAVQMFWLDASEVGVPQKRERVFFIANRMGYEPLRIDVEPAEPVTFGQVRSAHGVPLGAKSVMAKLAPHRIPSDKSFKDISLRVRGKFSMFNNRIISDSQVCDTLTAKSTPVRMHDGMKLSREDLTAVQTFPHDYDFGAMSSHSGMQFVCGMSVPPRLMEYIANQIKEQWLDKEAQ